MPQFCFRILAAFHILALCLSQGLKPLAEASSLCEFEASESSDSVLLQVNLGLLRSEEPREAPQPSFESSISSALDISVLNCWNASITDAEASASRDLAPVVQLRFVAKYVSGFTGGARATHLYHASLCSN